VGLAPGGHSGHCRGATCGFPAIGKICLPKGVTKCLHNRAPGLKIGVSRVHAREVPRTTGPAPRIRGDSEEEGRHACQAHPSGALVEGVRWLPHRPATATAPRGASTAGAASGSRHKTTSDADVCLVLFNTRIMLCFSAAGLFQGVSGCRAAVADCCRLLQAVAGLLRTVSKLFRDCCELLRAVSGLLRSVADCRRPHRLDKNMLPRSLTDISLEVRVSRGRP
jgi:hypothetical protein